MAYAGASSVTTIEPCSAAVLAPQGSPCRGGGTEPGAAPRAPAHALFEVLGGAGDGEAAVAAAAGGGEVQRAVGVEVLLGIREGAAGLEAASDCRAVVVFLNDQQIPRVLPQVPDGNILRRDV